MRASESELGKESAQHPAPVSFFAGRGEISVVDVASQVLRRFFVSTPGLESFFLRPEKSQQINMLVVVVYPFSFPA